MKRTSFVCFGIQGNKDALVYQEVPGRDGGEEFFLFFSPGAGGEEALLRSLFRDAVSTSRLGVAVNYFQHFVERFGEALAAVDEAEDPLDGAILMVEIRRGDEIYILCNRNATILHWTASGGFLPLESLTGVVETPLRTSGSQRDLFLRAPEDFFILYHFKLVEGDHTLVGAPSREFIDRSAAELKDSVLFPGFEIPAEMGMELDVERSFPVLHWKLGGSAVPGARPAERARGRRGRLLAAGVGAAAVIGAVLILAFAGWKGERGGPKEQGPAALLSAGDSEGSGSSSPGGGGTPGRETPRTRVSFAEAWKKEFKGAITSSPRSCGLGVVFGCRDGSLYAYRSDGSLLWRYRAGAGIGASPACAGDRVIGANYRGSVFCLDGATGKRLWSFAARAKIVSSPQVWQQEVIVGTTDGRVVAVSLDTGRRLWEKKIGASVWADPVVGKDYIVAATSDGALVRLDHRGRIAWSRKVGGGIYSSPLCVEGHDLIIFGTKTSYIYACALSDGKERWKYRAGGEVSGSPALGAGAVFIGAKDRACYALTLDGKLLWRRDVGGSVLSRPLVLGDSLFVTTYGGKLVALDGETGDVTAEYRAASSLYSSPATDGRRIYFGSNGGVFHALELPGRTG